MQSGHDPHLLYQAINITVEMQYTVPMTLVYNLLLKLKLKRKPDEKEPKVQDIIRLLSTIGTGLLSDTEDKVEIEDTEQDLKTRIKYILKLTNCELSNQDLNKILRGELSIKDVMNKDAQLAWNMMFEMQDDRQVPSTQNVEWLLNVAENYAIGQITKEYNNNCYKYAELQSINEQNGNTKTMRALENPTKYLDRNKTLEEQMRKLRIYIGHLQGYDHDRDGDGERGIDPETGYVRDYDDICLANHVMAKGIDRQVQEIEHDM